jgi:hypothetical protein
MSNLLNTYENMIANAREQEAEKEATAEETAVVEERISVLEKYATTADGLLSDEYGEDYTEEDVTKLATMMINKDIEDEATAEKVSDYVEAGKIMARSFKAELDSIEESADSEEGESTSKE